MRAAVTEAISRDQDIVELLRLGRREQALEALLGRYEGKVYRLCCALLGERTQAEDAAQESLLRVCRAIERYDGRASLSSWIYAIARNRCLTALQRRRAHDALESLDEDPGSVPARVSATEELWNGRAERLRDLVEGLPERLRRVLVLYYFEERSVGEVALMLGSPEGTVKTTLFRARAALTELLKRRGLDNPADWQEA